MRLLVKVAEGLLITVLLPHSLKPCLFHFGYPGMNDKEFALECSRVNLLDFVNSAVPSEDHSYVLVDLVSSLTTLLPPERGMLIIARSDFSVQYVIERFERDVLEHLVELGELAQSLLRSVKEQANK